MVLREVSDTQEYDECCCTMLQGYFNCNERTGLSALFNNLAIIYMQQGNYADDISCYNEVLRIDPLAADGLVNRGNTYKEIGRVNEAIQDYSHAIVIRPKQV